MWSEKEEADYLNEKRDRCTVDHYITNSCRSLRVCVRACGLTCARETRQCLTCDEEATHGPRCCWFHA